MPGPQNKQELLQLNEANYQKLLGFIDGLSAEKRDKEFPLEYMNRNIRDVLAHLHHWHLMMLRWHEEGMAGKKLAMPAEGYTWKIVPDLNRAIWISYNQTPYNEVIAAFKASYNDVRRLIEQYSDEALFAKKKYAWIGSTSLGAYFVSATSSHYDWALKLIKKALK